MEEMRRKDREVTELETVKEIIRQCDVLRLGLADGDYPYIVPMNFGWEEKEGRLYFYLHGAQAMRLLIDRYLPGAPGCPPQTMAHTAMWRLEVADWSAKENKD